MRQGLISAALGFAFFLLLAGGSSASLIGDDVGYDITITFANLSQTTESGMTTVTAGVEVDPIGPSIPYLALDVDSTSFELIYDDAVNRAFHKIEFTLTDLDWTDRIIGATFLINDVSAAIVSITTTGNSVSFVFEEDPFFAWFIGDRLVVGIELLEEAPEILSITDVPNDQGRSVRLNWNRSAYDSADPTFTIAEYNVWRRIDSAAALSTSGNEPGLLRSMYPPETGTSSRRCRLGEKMSTTSSPRLSATPRSPMDNAIPSSSSRR